MLLLLPLGDRCAAGKSDAPAKRVIWADEPVVIDLTNVEKPRKYFQRMWDSSVYPQGNGRLGCTTYGEPRKETIQFNEDSLWVGNEDCTGGYQPFGEVFVEMPHQEFSDYRRELDISRAVQTITYRSSGVSYKREYFSSHPAQVMVFRFSADKKSNQNHSSEKQRKNLQPPPTPRADRRSFKEVPIHQETECPLDPAQLPPDGATMNSSSFKTSRSNRSTPAFGGTFTFRLRKKVYRGPLPEGYGHRELPSLAELIRAAASI